MERSWADGSRLAGRGRTLVLLCVLLAAAAVVAPPATHAAAATVSLSAVPTGDLPQPSPVIRWSSGAAAGRLTMAKDDEAEQVVGTGSRGRLVAPWLVFGHRYVLRVYANASGGKPVTQKTVGRIYSHPADIVPPGPRPAATGKLVNVGLALVPALGGLWLLALAAHHVVRGRHQIAGDER